MPLEAAVNAGTDPIIQALTLSRRHQLRRRARRLVAGLVGGVLVGSLLAPLPAGAEPKPGPSHLSGQVERLDNVGGEVRGIAWPVRQPVDVAPPAAVWPKPGTFRMAAARTADHPMWIERVTGTDSAAAAQIPEVTAQVLDRAAVPAPWRDGLVVRLGAAQSTSATGPVTVAVDYSAFRHAVGAGWASRLKFWLLPECALTSPGRTGCDARAVPSVNRTASQVVTADVTVAPLASGTKSRRPLPDGEVATSGTLIALAAGASGSGGDFAATPMAASSTWAAGGSSGDFSWSYALQVPPDIGGPSPALSLGYSSSSVDGRSEATNNQPSWIGEGFEYWPGYIERRYVSCSEDRSGSPNNTKDSGDLCWRSDNATMSLNGSGSELVFQAGEGWHARNEDGSRIEKLTGGNNGDDNGEYWKVTASDGTQYFFGLNRPAGQSSDTNSTWTVPVFGNHTNEPCHATAFMDSDCAQAWRWNLDYVIDPRGNTMSYWYDKELNQYAQYNTDTNNAAYVRGGTLKQIDYGTWDRGSTDRSVAPVAQVVFTSADRCVSDCWTGTPPAPNKPKWPDTPWDQECKLTATSCPTKYSPTFWSTKRLSKITTKVWDTTQSPAKWQDVDSWTLGHSFPPTGDGSVHPGLWLDSITHAGHVGSTVTMPPVTFTPISLPNRVLSPTNTTNNWQRIDTIVSEIGALINVDYSLPECTSSNLPSAAYTNTKRCYPVIGIDPADPYGKALIIEWWHKYVVTAVSESDVQLVGGHQAPPKFTFYEYGGTPAWHYADDDGLTKPDRKTWNQYRGYATVRTRVGDVPGQQTLTETRYLRGMHGDRSSPSGGTRTVTVSASMGTETVYDEDQFAGMVREQIVYNGVDTRPVSKTVNVPWMSPATASRTINGDTVTARFVNTKVSYAATALGVDGARGWRTLRTENKFHDSYGTLEWSQNDGEAAPGDERCVSNVYNRNLAKNILGTVKQTTTTALACGVTPTQPAHIISDSRISYDQAASPDTPPVYGSVSKSEQLKDWTAAGGTQWQTTTEATFDAFGRTLTVKNIKGNVTTTGYTPASGGPVIEVKETTPLNWVTTKQIAPYWDDATTKITDPNGRVTDVVYDQLGRLAKAWRVGWSRVDHPDTPSVEYSYMYSPTRSAYPYTETKTLNAGGGLTVTYDIYDALLRPRQTQRAAVGGGRVVTDTIYDRLGRADTAYAAHVEPGTASGALWWEPEWSVPAVAKTVFDNASRPTAQIFLASDGVTNLVEKWRTTTAYEGDLTKVTPPAGGIPTTTLTDIRGRMIEKRQHTTAAGVGGPYDAIVYTYDHHDKTTKVVDQVGNEWTYTFDIRGRPIESRDPDRGLTRNEYNDYNELIKNIDARGQTLVTTYDQLGRKTELREGSATGPLRAKWTYDRLYTGQTVRGQLTETTRYEPAGSTNEYKWQVRGFTTRYQVAGLNVIIPSVEGTGLSGTWVYGYGYSPYDGSPTEFTYPAGGGLAGETVTTTYDPATGLPTGLNTNLPGVGSYVAGQQYTGYGEPTVTTRKTASGVYVESDVDYDQSTRRVIRTAIQPETAVGTVSDRTYTHDPAGNITVIAEAPQVGSAETQCFRHDGLRRLTSAWTPKTGVGCASDPTVANLGGPAPYWQDWTLDAAGNRLSETSHASGGDTVRTYTVPAGGAGVVRPHALTAVTTTAPGQAPVTTRYDYDNTGNTICRPAGTVANTCPAGAGSQILAWDAEGRLATVASGGTTIETNIYDAEGARLVRRDTAGTTLYLPGMELRRQGTTTTATRYYNFGQSMVASRTPSGLTWLFSDHQGTQQVAVDAASQQVSVRYQTPYGGARGTKPAWPNQKGFVGGVNDPTGLTHIGAREYDPAIGRFISDDPLMDLKDPQQIHGYAYSGNNPITFSDPTGLKQCGDDACQIYEVKHSWGFEIIDRRRLGPVTSPSRPWVRGFRSCSICQGGPFRPKITRVYYPVKEPKPHTCSSHPGGYQISCADAWRYYMNRVGPVVAAIAVCERTHGSLRGPCDRNMLKEVKVDGEWKWVPRYPLPQRPEYDEFGQPYQTNEDDKTPKGGRGFMSFSFCAYWVCVGFNVTSDGGQITAGTGARVGVSVGFGYTTAPAREQGSFSLQGCAVYVAGVCGSGGNKKSGGVWGGGSVNFGFDYGFSSPVNAQWSSDALPEQ